MPSSSIRLVDKSNRTGSSEKGGAHQKSPKPFTAQRQKSDTEPSKKPAAMVQKPSPKASSRKLSKRAATAADLMRTQPICCQPNDTLNTAAQLLWEHNLGALVVVDDGGKPVSMLTDRDVCFAAYTQGVPLWASKVETAMSKVLITCEMNASISKVRDLMTTKQLRRLPVVDERGAIVGVISLKDLIDEAAGPVNKVFKRASTAADLVSVLTGILKPEERFADAAE